jgi:hypothetical protein
MLKFNALTGQFDLVGVPVVTDSSQPSEVGPDGDIQTQYVQNDGRIYFRVNGKLYYVSGIQALFALNIKKGQPIGLMGITYANDVN